jgi:N-acetylglucosamine-6-phosphate deacetylase
MSEPLRVIGKLAGSSSVVRISYGGVVHQVEDLITPAETSDYITTGFIDLQVNGFAGADYNDPSVSHEAISQSLHAMFATGVTRVFPTIITASEQRIVGALRNLRSAKEEFARNHMPEAAALEAFHVEGPHISPEDGPRGAHPNQHVRPPDVEEYKRWQEAADGNIRLITFSPEWDDAPAYVAQLTRSGVVASIGHTKAISDQIAAAVDAGATMSTHLGNGAHPVLNKTQNYIWDQLAEDRLTASFILDNIHIPPHFFRTALRAKGVERSVLVTDAVMPANCSPGPYTLGEVDVELKPDGRVVLRGGERLAGSSLRMDRVIANAVDMGGISVREALVMATTNPARAGRIPGRQRGLAAGDRADIVRFTWNEESRTLTVRETILAGSTVYSASSE